MSRKQRARNKKPGARQQRILDKYKDMPRSPYSMFDRSQAARTYRKMIAAKGEVKRWIKFIEEGPKSLNLTPLEIRQARTKMYSFQNKFLVEKQKYYEAKDRKIIESSNIGADIITNFDEGIDDHEQQIVDEIRDKLDNYRKGDETITKYYHQYGYDSISDLSIYAFARMEGLL